MLVALFFGVPSKPSYAEETLNFVFEGMTCPSIFLTKSQWKKYPPSLSDPQKIPLFSDDMEGTEVEWNQLYLPKRELTQQEVERSGPKQLIEYSGISDSPQNKPGLLVNSQPWIDFLTSCPNRISSNRQMDPRKTADWVAPHFFELYELPLEQGLQTVVVTQFRDHSPYFGDDYLALYLTNDCSTEKLLVTQGGNQQLEFLHRNGRLLISIKSPDRGMQTFYAATEDPDANSSFVEICSTVM